jgi:hypothetical protein
LTVLRAGGFSPRSNGVGVFVPVPQEQKAAPFRLLAEARIAVEDFDLVDHSSAGRVSEVEPWA